MMRSAFARRVVTGLTLVVMLLCQTMAAALACGAAPAATPAVAPAQTATADSATPCRHEAVNTRTSAPDHGCQDRCPSRDASFETTKLNIPAAVALAVSIFTVDLPAITRTVTVRYETIVAYAASPPLRLVYCRLLN